jgi:PASTA domain-containing protein
MSSRAGRPIVESLSTLGGAHPSGRGHEGTHRQRSAGFDEPRWPTGPGSHLKIPLDVPFEPADEDAVARGLAGRNPRRSTSTAPTRAMAILSVMLGVAAGIAIASLVGPPATTDARIPAIEPSSRVDVPDVRGMSAREARVLLERAGLRFERAIPAKGTPGRVLGTRPSIGSPLSAGTSVTVIVGVDVERLVADVVSSVSPASSSPSP